MVYIPRLHVMTDAETMGKTHVVGWHWTGRGCEAHAGAAYGASRYDLFIPVQSEAATQMLDRHTPPARITKGGFALVC